MRKYSLLFILILAFLIRFPGIFWGKVCQDDFNLFQHDEWQHVEIGIRQIQEFDPGFLAGYEFRFQPFNTPGLGSQIALVAYPISKIFPLKAVHLLIIGRLISLLYSMLMIWLLYKMALFLFNHRRIALLAALLYAVFDLGITHGRYAIPPLSYGFWAYLGVYQIMKFRRKFSVSEFQGFKKMVLPGIILAVPFGLTMSLKYDFIPFALFSLLLLFFLIRNKEMFKNLLLIYLLVISVMTFSFFASTFFQFSFTELFDSYSTLYKENKDAIPVDSHWLTNPVVYFFAVLAGSSVFVFSFSVLGFIQLMKQKVRFHFGAFSIELAILFLFILMEFMVRWSIDTPFIRRANIFMPCVALMAGFGAWYFIQEVNWKSISFRKAIIAATIVYTFGISLVSQYNFWFEPRYCAAAFIEKNMEIPEKVYAPPYSQAIGLPKNTVQGGEEADLILIHENLYSRYTKSFTTPLIVPESQDYIYHCFGGTKQMKFMQSLVFETGDFRITKKFSGSEIFPERILFKYLFGSYEPFNGDFLILTKKRMEE